MYRSGGFSDIHIFTFEPDKFKITIEVMVPDDDIVEETEEHHIILLVPDGETGVNLLQESVTIVVMDDDGEGVGGWKRRVVVGKQPGL